MYLRGTAGTELSVRTNFTRLLRHRSSTVRGTERNKGRTDNIIHNVTGTEIDDSTRFCRGVETMISLTVGTEIVDLEV